MYKNKVILYKQSTCSLNAFSIFIYIGMWTKDAFLHMPDFLSQESRRREDVDFSVTDDGGYY